MIYGSIGTATVTRRPHPGGAKGAMMSLDEVAKRAWAARSDPLVRAWTTQQLQACGWPTGRRSQAQCVVDAFKRQVKYVEDPLQVEAMFGPRQTLCLDKSGLCVVGADCDDMTITLDACLMSIGWRVWVVGASYRDPAVPTHVYGAFEDELAQPVRFDATTDYQVGNVAPFVKEWWIDPAKGVSMDGAAAGEFVGVGRVGELTPWDVAEQISINGRATAGFGLGAFIITASDIEQEQARTLAVAQGVDAGVAACAGIDAVTKQEWNYFYASLKDFCTRPVCNFWYPGMPDNCVMATASSGDTMVGYEKALDLWQKRLSYANCADLPPPIVPIEPSSPLPSAQTVTTVLKWGAVLAGVGGAVYLGSKFIPSR